MLKVAIPSSSCTSPSRHPPVKLVFIISCSGKFGEEEYNVFYSCSKGFTTIFFLHQVQTKCMSPEIKGKTRQWCRTSQVLTFVTCL